MFRFPLVHHLVNSITLGRKEISNCNTDDTHLLTNLQKSTPIIGVVQSTVIPLLFALDFVKRLSCRHLRIKRCANMYLRHTLSHHFFWTSLALYTWYAPSTVSWLFTECSHTSMSYSCSIGMVMSLSYSPAFNRKLCNCVGITNLKLSIMANNLMHYVL